MQATDAPSRRPAFKTLPDYGVAKIANRVLARLRKQPQAQRVYLFLQAHCNKRRTTWVGVRRLAEETDLSPATVKRAISLLEARGLILREKHGLGRNSTTTLVWPLPGEGSRGLTHEPSSGLMGEPSVPPRLALSGHRGLMGEPTQIDGEEAKLPHPTLAPPADAPVGMVWEKLGFPEKAQALRYKRAMIDRTANRTPEEHQAEVAAYRDRVNKLYGHDAGKAERRSPSEPSPAPDPLGGPAR